MGRHFTSFADIQQQLSNKSVTCVEVVETYLSNIEKSKHLNAYLEVFQTDALAQARAVDQKLSEGKAGKLAGMVIAIKDNICYKGHVVTAGSKILENFTSIYNSTVIDRLLAEDAIIIGRTNCDEFAMGSSNENSAFGTVLNPLDNKRVPGGSSGGSAVAVAADLCTVALGSDTGGSIRQPASFCGVVGMKPTYGRVSRWGLIAYASSFDQIGPFSKNVQDSALVMEVIAGNDGKDSTASSKPVEDYSKTEKSKKYKVCYLKEGVESSGLDANIKEGMHQLIDRLKKEGYEVEGVDFPLLEYLVPAYYVLTTAEASSNLSRYDGIHYGYRSPRATDLDSTYKLSRTEGFGKEVKRRIMLGTFVLSAGYYDAYYSKAQKVRRIIQEKTKELLNSYDFILLPTTPDVAFEFGKNSKDPVKMYLEDIFTVQANLTGMPAISLPMGQHANGLPYGVQLIADKFKEKDLFSFSEYLMELA